jgi:alcohol dehydrogenase class IV
MDLMRHPDQVIRGIALCRNHRYHLMSRCNFIRDFLGGSADTAAVRELKNALIRLRKELELPATLTQAGIPAGQVRQKLDAICRAAVADPCCATNPVEVDGALARSVLETVMGRG